MPIIQGCHPRQFFFILYIYIDRWYRYLHTNFHEYWPKKLPDFIHLKQASILFRSYCTLLFEPAWQFSLLFYCAAGSKSFLSSSLYLPDVSNVPRSLAKLPLSRADCSIRNIQLHVTIARPLFPFLYPLPNSASFFTTDIRVRLATLYANTLHT